MYEIIRSKLYDFVGGLKRTVVIVKRIGKLFIVDESQKKNYIQGI